MELARCLLKVWALRRCWLLENGMLVLFRAWLEVECYEWGWVDLGHFDLFRIWTGGLAHWRGLFLNWGFWVVGELDWKLALLKVVVELGSFSRLGTGLKVWVGRLGFVVLRKILVLLDPRGGGILLAQNSALPFGIPSPKGPSRSSSWWLGWKICWYLVEGCC